MTTTALGWLFLAVSVLTLLIQLVSVWRLRKWPRVADGTQDAVYRGLLRTSLCRVFAAVLYVAMGTATLLVQSTLPVLALTVFTAVQVMWQLNSFADVRLRRRLAADAAGEDRSGHARHV